MNSAFILWVCYPVAIVALGVGLAILSWLHEPKEPEKRQEPKV